MNIAKRRIYNVAKTVLFAGILCAVTLWPTAPPVNAQSPANRTSRLERFRQARLNRDSAQNTGDIRAAAGDASVADPLENGYRASTEQKKTAVAGSWLCEHTITSPPEEAGVVFKSLQAFTEDGRAFSNGQGDIIPPVITPQMGAWEFQGGSSFVVTLKAIVYDPSSGIPPGDFLGTTKISETMTVDGAGNTFTGHFQFADLDANGNVLFSGEGTFQGTRINVEPF